MGKLWARAIFTSLLLAGISAGAAAQWYQGPSGAPGGDPFDGWMANQHASNIRNVIVFTAKSDGALQCVTAQYVDSPLGPGGLLGASSPDGCNVANPADVHANVQLDPDEYILGIAGTYTDHVTSLRFYTNKRNSPIFGEGQKGTTFGYTAPLGQMIVAFIHSNDVRLRSIGVMYAPCNHSTKACH